MYNIGYFCSGGEAMDYHFKMNYGCDRPDFNFISDNNLHDMLNKIYICKSQFFIIEMVRRKEQARKVATKDDKYAMSAVEIIKLLDYKTPQLQQIMWLISSFRVALNHISINLTCFPELISTLMTDWAIGHSIITLFLVGLGFIPRY